jgi:hypothetical protein
MKVLIQWIFYPTIKPFWIAPSGCICYYDPGEDHYPIAKISFPGKHLHRETLPILMKQLDLNKLADEKKGPDGYFTV